MFLGRYEHSIDEKGRMIIPARYRELLIDGAYVTQGFDRNLMVLTAPIFDRISERINHLSMTDPDARQLKRLIFSSAERLDTDRAGRVLIPQYLRDVAGLVDDVMIVGVGEYFEIWARPAWEEHVANLNDGEANAQRFTALDLSL